MANASRPLGVLNEVLSITAQELLSGRLGIGVDYSSMKS